MTLIEKINKAQKRDELILLLVESGKVYLLRNHWRYLQPVKVAKRELLGTVKGMKDRLIYITEPIRKL